MEIGTDYLDGNGVGWSRRQTAKYDWRAVVRAILVTAATLLFTGRDAFSQTWLRTLLRVACHNQGNLQVTVTNSGAFGVDNIGVDPFTGVRVSGLTFPRNNVVKWGAVNIMLGGILGNDTLVNEYVLIPDQPPDNEFKYQTIISDNPLYSPEAKSEFDIVCSYNDSVTDPAVIGHTENRPLYVRFNQRSMAWSAPNLDDFILVDCEIRTFQAKTLKNCYVGIELWPFIRNDMPNAPGQTSVVGSLSSFAPVATCEVPDKIPVYYWMDGTGRPDQQQWTASSPLGAIGLVPLGLSADSPKISFNWFVGTLEGGPAYYYRAPLKRADLGRFHADASGFPAADRDFYFLLSNGYQPYDQLQLAIDHSADGWLPPPPDAEITAAGRHGFAFVGIGPFDLRPNQTVRFTYAIVGGDNVHVNPNDFANRWNPYQPDVYYNSLDFTELMTNARWAKWVYDNPGVDTDGDGYFGKFHVCDGDTQWYEGDGVPDFRADAPPPAPKLKVIPSTGSLAIRWNGYYSENAIDPFTKIKDFEGYRVYAGLDDRESSMTLLISWDHQNYNRYFLRQRPNGTWAWETKDLPLTLDSLRVLYGDGFAPMLYTRDNPWHWNDTLFSFTQVDYNMSLFSPTGVHKVYPEARQLGTDTLQWTPDDLTTEHGEPLPKYYEYEYVFNDVLPTIAQYISVTAFDFGFAKGNIPAKESNKLSNRIIAYAQNSADSVETKDLNVYVYPNPYLFNVNYAAQGYENHDNSQIRDRSHRLNFGNLPPKCRISIYSLDGDLIRSWEHDYNPSDPQAMHDSWDLITRNTMLPAAGLYYWTVESPTRTQIGKFVIIE